MPLTVEELQKSEYYQKLKEQDRTQYLNELEQKRKLSGGGVIVTEDGNQIINEDSAITRFKINFFNIYLSINLAMIKVKIK